MLSAFVETIHGSVTFKLPAEWQVRTIADFAECPMKGNACELAVQALKTPVNAPPLAKRLTSHDRVSILIEDLTRSSPKKEVLRGLLEVLNAIGIPPKNISIVIALGTHRALSQEEMETGYGADIVSRYRFFNHDCHASDLVTVGKLETGAVVKINRHVCEADFRIGIGSIFPHPLNGFGGGGKILFPGVADFESIFEHHLKHSFVGQSRLGNIAGNEFYREVNRLARLGKLDFIINSVLDYQDRLHDLVCGDPVDAHREGTEICRRIVSKKFNGPADITIISAFPYSEGPQIMKPLAAASLITRKGGWIILYADCSIPLPKIYFKACEQFRARYGNGLRKAVLEHFANNRPIMADSPPELNMSLAQVLLTLNDFKTILVAGDIAKHDVERLGFCFAENMDQAIDIGMAHNGRSCVHIVPSGGVILPVIG